MRILAIETSFDETAAAVVEDGVRVISNILASSALMHKKYGGVVPEVAAREQLKFIIPVITETIAPLKKNARESTQDCIAANIDALAVTTGPGLIGSLLVGVETAKTLSFVCGKPLIPVNHVVAHVYANFIERATTVAFPAISLVVSGGHTELYLMNSEKEITWLGGTVDDAAGEAFDKTARLLGLGNGGGPAIQKSAEAFDAKGPTITLPRPMLNDTSFHFSFSGLKTATMREWKKYPQPDATLIAAFSYEVQEAITDVLVKKTLRAAARFNAKSILVSGGVAANTRLKKKFELLQSPIAIYFPSPALCTDNAVFIASYAFFRGKPESWDKITAAPDLSVEVRD
jgi:N6-L-threonylcarbamoyladenine synthase